MKYLLFLVTFLLINNVNCFNNKIFHFNKKTILLSKKKFTTLSIFNNTNLYNNTNIEYKLEKKFDKTTIYLLIQMISLFYLLK